MKELLDTDGENLAVRCFLLMYIYSSGNCSAKMMKIHLEHSGFNDCWPAWVNDPKCHGHLTKSGAQDWLRYLFSLEPKVDRIEALEKQNAELLVVLKEIDHISQAFHEGGYGKEGDKKAMRKITHLAQTWLRAGAALQPSTNQEVSKCRNG